MKLSVVVPTHDRNHNLLNLIGSLKNQNFDRNQFELIVVTNLVDPFFESELFKYGVDGILCEVHCSGEKNVNKARNLGIKKSRGEIIFLVDDDCELIDENYLEMVAESHAKFPEAVAIGGSYKVFEESNPLDKAYNCVGRQWQALDHFGSYESSRLVGGNVSYKRSVLEDNSLQFDEEIRFGGSESEFHQRLMREGYQTIYLPNLVVGHLTNLTQDDLIRKAFKQAHSFLKYDIADGFSEKVGRTYQNRRLTMAREPVSYTHQTLPTKRIV